jgi:hypothetical protein
MDQEETTTERLSSRAGLAVAVLIPCLEEERTIATVVTDFRAALPEARVYVYDNGSSDRTVEAAIEAGATVKGEPVRGKGNVVRRMFADVDADIYVLVDGDDTYDATAASRMIERLIEENLDMVAGARTSEAGIAARRGHRFGNRVLSSIVARVFGNRFRDMLTGYRVLSRRFVKSFPALTSGFETETELTVHALTLSMPVAEVTTAYKERPEGSDSKLRTINDGLRILTTILIMLKEERPFAFFTSIFAVLAATSLLLAWPLFVTFVETGLVPRFPTAILASAIMLLAFLSLACGLILDTVTRGRRELRRMHYLGIAPPGA